MRGTFGRDAEDVWGKGRWEEKDEDVHCWVRLGDAGFEEVAKWDAGGEERDDNIRGSYKRCEVKIMIWEMQVRIVTMKVKYSFLRLT